MTATIETLRTMTAAQSTEDLLHLATYVEARDVVSQGERIAYSVACAVLAERLGVSAASAAQSSLGAAEHLRLVATLSGVIEERTEEEHEADHEAGKHDAVADYGCPVCADLAYLDATD